MFLGPLFLTRRDKSFSASVFIENFHRTLVVSKSAIHMWPYAV